MKQVPLSEVKNDLSRYLRLAETEDVIITRHGQPAGVLIGFADEDAWFEYRLQHDPRFQRRVAEARESLRDGRGVRLEDLSANDEGRGGAA
jgi:prevent-host-death family protein